MSRSALEGVRHLDEELSPGLLQPFIERQLALVAVSDKQDRLPIELVSEQSRGGEAGGSRRHRRQIEFRLAIGGDVLTDGPHERARRKAVIGADPGYPCGEQLLPAS